MEKAIAIAAGAVLAVAAAITAILWFGLETLLMSSPSIVAQAQWPKSEVAAAVASTIPLVIAVIAMAIKGIYEPPKPNPPPPPPASCDAKYNPRRPARSPETETPVQGLHQRNKSAKRTPRRSA